MKKIMMFIFLCMSFSFTLANETETKSNYEYEDNGALIRVRYSDLSDPTWTQERKNVDFRAMQSERYFSEMKKIAIKQNINTKLYNLSQSDNEIIALTIMPDHDFYTILFNRTTSKLIMTSIVCVTAEDFKIESIISDNACTRAAKKEGIKFTTKNIKNTKEF